MLLLLKLCKPSQQAPVYMEVQCILMTVNHLGRFHMDGRSVVLFITTQLGQRVLLKTDSLIQQSDLLYGKHM